MVRIYIKRKDEIAGRVFTCKLSIKNDKVAILPFIGCVTKGLITKEEWAKSQELIADKFDLYITESYIDGRCKSARNMPKFNWKEYLNMKQGDTFKPVGYKVICNYFGIEIEISNCNSMVRYRVGENGTVSDWIEIHFTTEGRPFFRVNKKIHGCTRYYLDEFMRI